MKGKRKNLYFEMMRILACFFVIFNHTGERGYFLFSQRPLGGRSFGVISGSRYFVNLQSHCFL